MSRTISKVIRDIEQNVTLDGNSLVSDTSRVIDGHRVEPPLYDDIDPSHGTDPTLAGPDRPDMPEYDPDYGTSGGTGGSVIDTDYTYTPGTPLVHDVPVSVQRKVTEVITDYSQEKLQEYQDADGVAYAVFKDGTKRRVEWSEVQEIPLTPTRTVTINLGEVAASSNQNFWTDDDGAHVTSDLKESWKEEYNEADHGTLAAPTLQNPWHNILLNSLGILLRRGLINLAGLGKDSISFYDGNGNDEDNITAVFGSHGAQIGKNTENHLILSNEGLSAYDEDGNLIPVYAENIAVHQAVIDNLEATYATITDLDVANGNIDNLTAITLSALYADIDSLTADEIDALNLNAINAAIHNLETDNFTTDNLTAINALIDTLRAHRITTDILEAGYADIELANVNNAWIENGVIKNEAVTSAQIQGVSANKLTAGTINADDIIVKNLDVRNLKVGRLNGNPIIGGYEVVSTSISGYSSKNPVNEGWYEYVNNNYVLSQDTSVRNGVVYYKTADRIDLYDKDTIDQKFNNVDARIDSQIETWTGTTVPLLSNYPANQWNAQTIADHVGDIYYVINAGNEYDGFTYRFAYDNTQQDYKWVLIRDNAVTDAISRIVTAEGDIGTLKTFQSDTNSWIRETDDGLETIRENHTELTVVVDKTIVETTQLWFSKANTTAPAKPTSVISSTSTAGNAWRTVVPAYNASYPNYFYCYQWKYVDGTYGWSNITRDIAMGESQSVARAAAASAGEANDSLAEYITNNNLAVTNLGNKIDDISIGGRNLLRNTGIERTETASKYGAWSILTPCYEDEYAIDLDEGDYVLSFDWESDSELPNGFRVWIGYGNIHGSGGAEVRSPYSSLIGDPIGANQTAGHVIREFYWPDANDDYPYFACRPIRSFVDDSLNGITFTIKNAKLEKGNKATDWTPAPEDLYSEMNALQQSLQNQIDEQVDIWYYNTAPTTSNAPFNTWTDTATKDNHVGDLYFDTSKGYSYKLTKSGTTYSWTRIKDSDIDSALSAANTAQTTADNKRRVFTSQPTVPYDIGDLWVSNVNGEVRYANKVRTSGSFTMTEWSLTATDDSSLNAYIESNAAELATIITNTNNKIDDISIGGRNLLLNSDKQSRDTTDIPSRYNSGSFNISEYGRLVSGETYTITVEGVNDGRRGLCPYVGGGSYNVGRWKDITDIVNIKETWTFVCSDVMANANQFIRIYASNNAANSQGSTTVSGTFTCTHVKLEQGNKATDWTPAPEDLYSEINELQQSLQNQIDEQVDIWYYNTAPTTSNAPFNTWTDNTTKDNHVGDLYFDTSKGYSYRLTKSGSAYSWTRIKDSDINSALSAANTAQTTADNKRRIFTSTPTVPYDIGDLWVKGNEVRYANAARTSGSYTASEWSLTATDDTLAKSNIKSSVQLWFTKANTTAPAAPTAQVVSTATSGNVWTTVVPTYNASYPYYFYCWQYQKGDNSYSWSTVVYDRATTENQQNSHAALTGLETKVNSTTFKELEDTVGTQGSTITSLSTKVENLKIGGRNLLYGTTSWPDDAFVDKNNITIDGDTITYGTNAVPNRFKPIQVSPNEELTIGFDVRSDTERSFSGNNQSLILLDYSSSTSISRVAYRWLSFHGDYSVTTDWSRVNITFTVPSDSSIGRLYVSLRNDTSNVPYQIRRIKVERGNKATDWTPAPEDMATASSVTTVTNIVNEVQQTADSNHSTIQELQTITSSLETSRDCYPNYWRVDRYSQTSKFTAKSIIPTEDDFISTNFIETKYIHEDDFNKSLGLGDYYIARIQIYIFMSDVTSISLTPRHDDAAAYYLNGTLIHSNAGGYTTTDSPKTVQFNAGWNKILILLNEWTGSDYAYFYNIKPSQFTNVVKVQAELDPYDDTTVRRRISSVEQDLDGFRTTVSETYATTTSVNSAIDNISIGARNLLLHTADLPLGVGYTANQKDGICAWNSAGQPALSQTNDGVKLTSTGLGSECFGIPLAVNGSVDNNEDVMLTFEARGTLTYAGQFWWIQASGSNIAKNNWLNGTSDISLDETEWTKFVVNVKDANANVRTCTKILLFYGLTSSQSGKWVEIRKKSVKLEKGNKSTNWTPAPEEMATELALTNESNQRKALYGTSSTAAGTAAKVVTCSNFVLYTGARVSVTFTNANTAATPTLNVNGTGAKQIRSYVGVALSEGEYGWAAASTLLFVYDGTYWRLQDSGSIKRLVTAETKIDQNANDITLRATKTEVTEQIGAINITPFFSYIPYTGGEYWASTLSTDAFTYTYMNDGWCRVQSILNETESTIRRDILIKSIHNIIKENTAYTWLIEFRNNNSTREGNATASAGNVYIVQRNDSQFWGNNIVKNITGGTQTGGDVTISNQILNDGTIYEKRFVKLSEATGSSAWTNGDAANVAYLCNITTRAYAGGQIDFEFRISLYEGEYLGPYKPYTGSQLYSTQAELKVANNAISTKVSTTDYTGATIASKINQSADSVKIQAKHVEIDGTAIFGNSAFQTGLNAALDNIQVGGLNLLRNTEHPSEDDLILINSFLHDSDINGTVIRLHPTTAVPYAMFKSEYLIYDNAHYRSGQYTVSFDAMISGVDNGYNSNVNDGIRVIFGLKTVGTSEYMAGAGNAYWCTVVKNGLTRGWQRFSHTFALPDNLSIGTQSVTSESCSIFVEFSSYKEVAPVVFRKVKIEQGNKATDWSPAPEDVDSQINAVAEALNGFTILWNYSGFSTSNNGEAYLCKWDPVTSTASDENGWVIFNGVKRTISKQMANPDNVIPFNIPIYLVYRLSSATATTGTNYMVFYNSGWKYTIMPTPTAIESTAWTWNAATDIILGKWVQTAAEGAQSECEIYNPPLTAKHVTTDTVTARSAKAAADTVSTNLSTEINQRKAAYGTCSTAAGTQTKDVACANFEYVAGNSLTVYFSTANSYAAGAVNLNVNGKGAKAIIASNATTSATNQFLWGAGAYITFRYTGSAFMAINEPRVWYGLSNTAAATAAKTDTTACTGAVICKGTSVVLGMTYDNTNTAPTLNIQSTGAKAVYIGPASTRPTKANGFSWLPDTTVKFDFDGSAWRIGGDTYIKGDHIITGTIDASVVDVKNIKAEKITSGKIKASQLAVSDMTNYCQLNENTASAYGFTAEEDSNALGTPWFVRNSLTRSMYISEWFDCRPGEYFRVSGEASSSVQGATTNGGSTIAYLNVRLGIAYMNIDGTSSSALATICTSSSSAPATYISKTAAVGANAIKFRVFVNLAGYAPFSGTLKVRKLMVERMANGELIVDGSVTADKIATNSLTIGKFTSDTQDDILNSKLTTSISDAQTAANSKRRVFTTTPTVPYDKGDLWVNGSIIKYATASRSSGSYTSSEWSVTATDDTSANEAISTANSAAKTATNYIVQTTSGIKIANANPSSATSYQQLTATSTEFVLQGRSMISLGVSSTYSQAIARIGDENDMYIKLDYGHIGMISNDYGEVFSVKSYKRLFSDGSTGPAQIAEVYYLGTNTITSIYGHLPRVTSQYMSVVKASVDGTTTTISSSSYTITNNTQSYQQPAAFTVTFSSPMSGSTGDFLILSYSTSDPRAMSFTYGSRNDSETISALNNAGPMSFSAGHKCSAVNAFSSAFGYMSRSYGAGSFTAGINGEADGEASVCFGRSCVTRNDYGFSGGYLSTASGLGSFAYGYDVDTEYKDGSVAFGMYTKQVNNAIFKLGNGSISAPCNAVTVISNHEGSSSTYVNGTASSNGSVVSSDARLKELISEIDTEEAIDFIMKLKPKHYLKQGVPDFGFYAQEVENIPKWGEVLVTKDNSGNYDLPDFRLLNYEGFIAPMVAAIQDLVQQNDDLDDDLETAYEHIEKLEEENKELKERLSKLEALVSKLVDSDIN